MSFDINLDCQIWIDDIAKHLTNGELTVNKINELCSGQVKLATVLESFQYKRSDSFGVNPPLY